MSWTDCKRDEDWGSRWGGWGKTAKMKAAQECSDRGYYSHRIHDCGGWRFRAECWEGVPGDWSRPYSDEAARERGHGNRNDAARADCRSKGYLGIDPNQWRDRGEWRFSLKCVNPDWHGDWRSEGCKDDGNEQVARHVNANGMSWEESADWLIARLPGDIWGRRIIHKWREHRGAAGMWVVARIENNDCKGGWASGWYDDGCQSNATHKFAAKVDAKGRSWEAAADHMLNTIGSTVNGRRVISKVRDHRGPGGMWVDVRTENNDCKGTWATDWFNDGCQNDGRRKYARKVDAKAIRWEEAADNMLNTIGNTIDGKNVVSKARDHRGAGGMWVDVRADDWDCWGTWLDGNWNKEGCQNDQTRRYSRKINAQRRDWDAAGDHVVQHLVPQQVDNKPVVNKWKDKNPMGVWGVVKVTDAECQPDFHGNDWNDDGCQVDGSRRYARQVNAKAMDWDQAADILIASDKTPKVNQQFKGNKVIKVFKENKGIGGMWVIVLTEFWDCWGTWLDANWNKEACQNDQTRRYARKINAQRRDWDVAGDHVVKHLVPQQVDNKPVVNKWKDKNPSGVWGVVKVTDAECQPDFHGNDWNDDGCQADGSRRYARQVNDKGMSNWELAADLLIASDKTPKPGQQFKGSKVIRVFREHKGTGGMWVIVTVEDNRCLGEWLDGAWKDDGCQKDQTRRYSRKVQAHKRDWDTAGDYVVQNLIGTQVVNKTVKEKFKDKNALGVWGIAKVEDVSCQPDFHGNDWNDDGCYPDGSRRYARQVNDKGMGNWEMAADILIASNKTPKVGQDFKGGIVTKVFNENKGVGGMWIIVVINDKRCLGEWLDNTWKDDGCQKDQTRRYSRKVQAHKREWDTAGEYVVKNLIGSQVENKLVKDKFKDKTALGVWGIAKVEDTSCQPDYHGTDWNDDGCQADGSRRYARQVNDKGMGNWELAADILIAGDKTPKIGTQFKGGKVTKVFNENKGIGGMWVIVVVDDSRCFGEWLDNDWKDDGCQKDQTRRYSRKIQAHKRDWNTAGEYVIQNLINKTVKEKPVKDKFKDKTALGVWGIAKVEDVTCQPDFHGNDWNDDGCQADGSRRYARQVNDKGMGNWELAADILIEGDKTPKVGQQFRGGKVAKVFREHKGAAGMWIIVIVDDNRCFGEWLDNDWKDDGCQKDQTRRYSRKVQAHKRDWDTAGDYVVQNLINKTLKDKTVKEKFKDKNALGVWGIAKVEDASCQPDYHGNDWNDDGCQADGSRRFARQINDKSMGNWELAADILIASDKTPKPGADFKGGKVTKVFKEHKGAAGMWIIVIVEDKKCLGDWADAGWKDDGCVNNNKRYSRKVNAQKREWEDAVKYLNTTLGETLLDKKIVNKTFDKPAGGTQGIWSWIYVEDNDCKPKVEQPTPTPTPTPIPTPAPAPTPAPTPAPVQEQPVSEKPSEPTLSTPTLQNKEPVKEQTPIVAVAAKQEQTPQPLQAQDLVQSADSQEAAQKQQQYIIIGIVILILILLLSSSSMFAM